MNSFILYGGLVSALASRLGDALLSLLLAGLALRGLLGDLLLAVLLLGLLVGALDVRVGRGDAGVRGVVGVHADLDFVAGAVEHARPRLVLGLELDLALERLDLFLVK